MLRSYEDKALDGFPSKNKVAAPDVVEPACELPEPPAHLSAVAKKLWYDLGNTLVGMRVMTPADHDAARSESDYLRFGSLFLNHDEWKRTCVAAMNYVSQTVPNPCPSSNTALLAMLRLTLVSSL
jgi:hypothetical protein